MSRTEIWRNFIIFGLFVLMLFITPFVFAKPSSKHSIEITTRKVEGAGKWPTQYLNIWAKNGNNYQQEYLLEGTVLRFPDQVIKLFHMFHDKSEKPGDHLKDLVKLWKEYEGTDIDGDGKSVPRIIDGQFPVRIESSSNREVNDKTLAYVDLEFLAEHKTHRTFDRKKFEARKMSPFAGVKETLVEAGYQAYARKDPKTGVITYDGTNADGSNVQAVLHADSPPPRDPEAADRFNRIRRQAEQERQLELGSRPPENCDNTPDQYLPSGRFEKVSCFKGMDEYQRADMVFKDVTRINQLRDDVHLDPRLSICIGWKESGLHNNAKGGEPDWGMFQVIDDTGKRILRQVRPVTQGFEHLYSKGLSDYKQRLIWEEYRDTMIKSSLANADIHHALMGLNAKSLARSMGSSILSRMKNGNMTYNDVYELARLYNGGPTWKHLDRVVKYGHAIANCYTQMKSGMNSQGSIYNKTAFSRALNAAK